jgi:hypothetical protein
VQRQRERRISSDDVGYDGDFDSKSTVAEEDLSEEREWVAEKDGIDGSIPLENQDAEGV